jgi:hypothetical protein
VRIAVIALLGIVLVSNVACGSNAEQEPTSPSVFKTYTNSSEGFSISIPDSWYIASDSWDITRMDNETITVKQTTFTSPSLCKDQIITFHVTSSYEKYTSVQAYYSEVQEPLWVGLDDVLIVREDLTIDGIPAIKVILNFVSDGDTVHLMLFYMINQQTLFNIVAEARNPICWDIYEDTFNTMLNSFHLVD